MSRIRSISIGVRLALAFGAVCAACLVVALVGLTGASRLETDTQTIKGGARTQQLLGEVNEDIALNADATVRHLFAVAGAPDAQDDLQKAIEARWPVALEALEEMKTIHTDDVAEIDKIEEKLEPCQAAVTKAIATSRQ